MKVRSGFVSNSSSSSFIVVFPEEPKSAADVQRMVFAERQEFENPYGDLQRGVPDYWPTSEIAEIVWQDIQHNGPITPREVPLHMECGTVEGFPRFDTPRSDALHDEWIRVPNYWQDPEYKARHTEAWEADLAEYRHDRELSKAEYFAKYPLPDGVIYDLEYSDNDGPLGVAMEHGHLFRRLYCIQVSKH